MSDIVVVFVKPPDVPVMVKLNVPIVAALLTVSVRVLVALAGLGLNDALTPPGRPEADKVTFPLNPLRAVKVIVLVPLLPSVRIKLFGDAEIE